MVDLLMKLFSHSLNLEFNRMVATRVTWSELSSLARPIASIEMILHDHYVCDWEQ